MARIRNSQRSRGDCLLHWNYSHVVEGAAAEQRASADRLRRPLTANVSVYHEVNRSSEMRCAALMLTLALATLLGLTDTVNAQQAADPRIGQLVRTGKLRVAVGVVAPHWAVKDPATGELRGVAVEIARALAKRMGVELVMVEYPSPPSVLDGLKTSAWDVGFLAIDPSRAALVDFSPPYLQIDATYLVQGSSPIQSVSDADQPGIRIAVTRKSVEDIVLSRMLKRAELRSVDTIPAGFRQPRAGHADALAVPRHAA